MGKLYGREWSLSIGNRQWTDLRVTFEIKRHLKKYPDPATITIYNLTADNRGNINQGDEVRLVAGYEGAAGLLYSGQVMDLIVNRDGPDWATTITARDGDAAWKSMLSTSLATNAPLQVAVGFVAGAMGLNVATSSLPYLQGLSTRGYSALVGPGHDILDRMLRPFDLRWMLQDGKLVIIPDDGATMEEAILLNKDSGLVGIPEPMTDSTKKAAKSQTQAQATKTRRLRLTSLLQPSMAPGRRIMLESVQYNGLYRIDELVHKGDSRGQDWYSIAEVSRSA